VTNLPDPTDHRQMRVSDSDRDQTAAILREATGQGRLTFDELDERLGQVYAAKTYADLAETTRDLPGTHIQQQPQPTPAAFAPARIGGSPSAKAAIAIMSGSRRSGPWVVPATFVAIAFMGGVELDLRQAQFSQQEVTIQVCAFMGGVSIVAGEDVDIDVSGFAFMGGFDNRGSSVPAPPGAPRVRVTGFAFMGGVDVQRRPAGSGAGPQPGIEGDHRPRITG
jgi:uncharacterized protein DUF1707